MGRRQSRLRVEVTVRADRAETGELPNDGSAAADDGAPTCDHGPAGLATGRDPQVLVGPLQGRPPGPLRPGLRGA